jgi:peroxiredoxin
LRAFAGTHGIAFPLLSDEGSRVIRALGLINARVQEDHAAYGIKQNPRHVDLPYPGVFVLDRDGVIAQKRFHQSYRERDVSEQQDGPIASGKALDRRADDRPPLLGEEHLVRQL